MTNYEKPKEKISSDSCNPKIVLQRDLFGLKADYLGSIKIDEPIAYWTKASCSKEKMYKKLLADACALKANLIQIKSEINPGEVIPPYHRSPCYRCIADYYSFEFDSLSSEILNQENREKVYYKEDVKLKWSDFKVRLPESNEKPYEFISNIQLRSGSISVWTGAYKDFQAIGVFYSDVSKVKSSFANINNEKITGLLFNLTQVYANRLTDFLNSTRPGIADRNKLQKIIDEYTDELNLEIENFNKDTGFGSNQINLQKWENKINSELFNYDLKK
jgi:hypothetical protein